MFRYFIPRPNSTTFSLNDTGLTRVTPWFCLLFSLSSFLLSIFSSSFRIPPVVSIDFSRFLLCFNFFIHLFIFSSLVIDSSFRSCLRSFLLFFQLFLYFYHQWYKRLKISAVINLRSRKTNVGMLAAIVKDRVLL